MTRKILNPAPGVSREIGFYLAGMEEVREQLHEAVEGMSDDYLGRPALPAATKSKLTVIFFAPFG